MIFSAIKAVKSKSRYRVNVLLLVDISLIALVAETLEQNIWTIFIVCIKITCKILYLNIVLLQIANKRLMTKGQMQIFFIGNIKVKTQNFKKQLYILYFFTLAL